MHGDDHQSDDINEARDPPLERVGLSLQFGWIYSHPPVPEAAAPRPS